MDSVRSLDATNTVCVVLSVIPYIGRKYAKCMSGIEKYFIFFDDYEENFRMKNFMFPNETPLCVTHA